VVAVRAVWRSAVRELYPQLAAAQCDEPLDVEYAFSTLMEAGTYPA
jgi:hypothetical protein